MAAAVLCQRPIVARPLQQGGRHAPGLGGVAAEFAEPIDVKATPASGASISRWALAHIPAIRSWNTASRSTRREGKCRCSVAEPTSAFLAISWKKTGFITADTRLSFVAVQDIGAAAAAVCTDVSGRRVGAPVLTSAEAIECGLDPMIVNQQEWLNEVGAPARPEHAHALGLTTTDFRTWARQSASHACTAGRTRP